MENTNEESPSPPIKATTFFFLSVKILRVTFCRAHLRTALFGFSFVVSPENCSALPVNRWVFIIVTAANLVTEWGVLFSWWLFVSFSQVPLTVRHCSCKAVSILRRMHKTESCRVNTAKEPSSSTQFHIHQAGSWHSLSCYSPHSYEVGGRVSASSTCAWLRC